MPLCLTGILKELVLRFIVKNCYEKKYADLIVSCLVVLLRFLWLAYGCILSFNNMKKKHLKNLEEVKAMVKNPEKGVLEAREEMEENYKDGRNLKLDK